MPIASQGHGKNQKLAPRASHQEKMLVYIILGSTASPIMRGQSAMSCHKKKDYNKPEGHKIILLRELYWSRGERVLGTFIKLESCVLRSILFDVFILLLWSKISSVLHPQEGINFIFLNLLLVVFAFNAKNTNPHALRTYQLRKMQT